MPGPGRVRVCVDHGLDELALGQAEIIASEIFAPVGVRVDWHDSPRACRGIADAILVDPAKTAPKESPPTALAQSFWTEVASTDRKLHTAFLGHVLAHEITHIIEDIPRHSDSGLMKARWNAEDYREMCLHALTFAPEDVELIHEGLAARADRRIISAVR